MGCWLTLAMLVEVKVAVVDEPLRLANLCITVVCKTAVLHATRASHGEVGAAAPQQGS
jgi:hypothetical protein